MIDIQAFINLEIVGGFVLREVAFVDGPIEDALGREAIARTQIVGREFRITICRGLPENELSITLYHEILEAATVAALNPPEIVCEFNEAGFEQAAKGAHLRWGMASRASLNDMLLFYGFSER